MNILATSLHSGNGIPYQLPGRISKSLLIIFLLIGGFGVSLSAQKMWINEFQYDNNETDANDFVEVIVEASIPPADVQLDIYTGTNGIRSAELPLTGFTVGPTIDGFTIYTRTISPELPNGPGGLSLVYKSVAVQFLSYEGTFVAYNGPAAGYLSVDVGIVGSDPSPGNNQSVQLTGTGISYSDFTWSGPATATPGALNQGQQIADPSVAASLTDAPVPPATEPVAPGEEIEYTLTITNSGQGEAKDVELNRGTPSPDVTTLVPGSFQSTPVAYDLTVIDAQEDMAKVITLQGFDPDGDALTFSIKTAPTHGTLGTITPGGATTATVTYTPADNFFGSDTFEYEVEDDDGNKCPATVVIQVQPVNDPPSITCGPSQEVLNTAGAQTVNGWATNIWPGPDPGMFPDPLDESFQPVTISFLSDNDALFSALPAIDVATGNLTYTPQTGAAGVANVTFDISDGLVFGQCMTTITVQSAPTAVADAPAANSAPGDDFHTALNTPLNSATTPSVSDNLLANDMTGFPAGVVVSYGLSSDATIQAVGGGTTPTDQGGTVEVTAAGEFIYTPPSATFTGLDMFAYRLQNSLSFSDAVVTIAVGGRPSCVNDNYDVFGNVGITVPVANGVLLNDLGDQLSVIPAAGGTANGGAVSIGVDGAFSYLPPAGFQGMDTYDYTIQNGFGTSTCTITFTVDGMIWFIDNSQATSGGGGLSTPFNSIAAFNTNASDAAGDIIFLYETGSGAYTGSLTLLDGQIVIGQGATASIATIAGITLPPYSNTLPATGGSRPTVSGNTFTIRVAQNNTVRGLNASNTNSGAGAAFFNSIANLGTLKISEVAITGTGQAIDIRGPVVLDVNLISVTGSGGENGISIDGLFPGDITGSFTVSGATSITNTTSTGIFIQNTGATFSFDATTLSSIPAAGVNLTNNTGSFTFNGLSITNTGGTGLLASSSGTLTVTGASNVLSTTTGTGVDIQNTTIGAGGVTFRSVSASGGTNGILLANTGSTGAFTVSGDGALARNGSGGTIQNTTGDAISLSNANGVVLQSMNITNAGGDAIESNGGSNVTLAGVGVTNPTGNGWLATNLTGSNYVKNDCLFTSINGVNTSAIRVTNTNTNLTLFEINDSNFTNGTSGQSVVLFESSGTSNMRLDVLNGCLFTDLTAQAVTAAAGQAAGSTGTMTTNIKDCSFQDSKGASGENNVGVLVANGATQTAAIENNTFNNVAKDGSIANASVLRTQNSGGIWMGTVKGNNLQNFNFGPMPGVSGRHGIGHVFEPVAFNASYKTDITIDGNSINGIPTREAIFIDYRDKSGGGDVKVINNQIGTITPIGSATNSQQVIEIRVRGASNAKTVNLLVDRNTAVGQTSSRFFDLDAEDLATVNATITNNAFRNSGTGDEIDVDSEDAGVTLCANISGNDLDSGAGIIELNETAGTLNITQASAAAMSTANGGATVNVTGTPQFGQPACTTPTP